MGGVSLLHWDGPQRPPLRTAGRNGIRRQVVQARHEVLREGYTSYAIALSTARIIEPCCITSIRCCRSACC